MPNVFNVPGVPALTGYLAGSLSLLVQDAISIFFGAPQSQWGLFLNGIPIIVADSVVSFDYTGEFRILDYPIEQGSFETYNKVRVPFTVKLRFATGGTISDRTDFLNSIEQVIGDLNLYDAVTPERIYHNVNVHHQDYRRTATQGVGLLTVDLHVEEVRVTASSSFTNTQQPDGANPASGGTVMASPITVTTASGQSSGPQTFSSRFGYAFQ